MPAGSGCGWAPTVSTMVGDGPRPCWKASRKSPPAAPCLERAPPSLGTKGGVCSSGTCFLPGTCGLRNTLVTEPVHSLRPAPRSQPPVSTSEPAARTGPATPQVRKPRCCGGVVSNTRGGAEHSGSASCPRGAGSQGPGGLSSALLTQAGEMATAPQALGAGTSLPASTEPAFTPGLEKPAAWSPCSSGDAVTSHLVAVAAVGRGRDPSAPGRL